jgi:hypothetical protein
MISTLIELHATITRCRSQEVKEALRAQMEMQRSLHEQVEVTSTASCVLSDKKDLLINFSIFTHLRLDWNLLVYSLCPKDMESRVGLTCSTLLCSPLSNIAVFRLKFRGALL